MIAHFFLNDLDQKCIQSFLLCLQTRIIAPSVSGEFPIFKSWRLKAGKVSFLKSSWEWLVVGAFFFSHVNAVRSKWQSLTMEGLFSMAAVTSSTQSRIEERKSPALVCFCENVTSGQTRIFSILDPFISARNPSSQEIEKIRKGCKCPRKCQKRKWAPTGYPGPSQGRPTTGHLCTNSRTRNTH